MIQFDIITIFPEIFDSYFKESLLLRAQKNKLIKIKIHDLRNYTTDKHRTVDDRPFAGGIGMVMKIEPIFRAVSALKKSEIRNPTTAHFQWAGSPSPYSRAVAKSETNSKSQNPKSKTILFTPRGKKFNQKIAYQLSKLDQLILICGRYEGIDERVTKIADIELSIGDYVLMGGELPAIVVIETISRLIPGVISKPQLLKERIPAIRGRGGRGFIEYPQYTRPEVFSPPPSPRIRRASKKWQVPKVLLSGNHKKIEEWRKKHQKIILQ